MEKLNNNKKGDMKIIVGIIIAIVVMFLVISIFKNQFIAGTSQFTFCKDSVDWDNDGIPDRMDPCVCKESSECTKENDCKQERNEDLGCVRKHNKVTKK